MSARYPNISAPRLREAACRCEGLLGRAVQELEGAEDTAGPLRETALSLTRRMAGGDELSLAELCITLETGPGPVCRPYGRDHPSARGTPLCSRQAPDGMTTRSGALPPRLSLPRSAPGHAGGYPGPGGLRTACGFNIGTGHRPGGSVPGSPPFHHLKTPDRRGSNDDRDHWRPLQKRRQIVLF